uniref:Ubiquitin-like protease family profile domain-containing protein n=1 Tax=Chenopodium quinoa TaxID=63459 RepID=A0A803KY96_CHEQI
MWILKNITMETKNAIEQEKGSEHEIGATNEPQNADARVEVEDDATLNQFLQGSGKKPYTPSVIGPIVDPALLNEIAKEDDASKLGLWLGRYGGISSWVGVRGGGGGLVGEWWVAGLVQVQGSIGPSMVSKDNSLKFNCKNLDVQPLEVKDEKAEQQHEEKGSKKKKDYHFKQIATKKRKKVVEHTTEEKRQTVQHEGKIMLKKRRAPLGEPYFPVKEKPEVGAAQSASQSKAQSTIVEVSKDIPRKNNKDKGLVVREKKTDVAEVDVGEQGEIKEEFTTSQRHTVQPLLNLIRGLEEQEEKLQAIRDMGFGGILHLDMPRSSPNFNATLVLNVDANEVCIVCARNRTIDIKPVDVHLVYGLPMGGKVIVEAANENEEMVMVMRELKAYHGGGGIPKFSALVDDLLEPNNLPDDRWKRSFLLLVVNCCIKSVANTQPLFKFMHTAVDTSQISSFDWCSYTIQSLIDSSIYYQGDVKRYFLGPLPFLMVCYFDRLQRKNIIMPRQIPLIKEWDSDKIAKRIVIERKLDFGLGTLLDRIEIQDGCGQPLAIEGEYTHLLRQATETIASGFVNLSKILKMGERFHNRPIDGDATLYNVAAMWSRLSGIKLSEKVINNVPSQRVEGSSILSQDTEFFASDWFGEMVDNVVKNSGVEGITVEKEKEGGEEEDSQPTELEPLVFSVVTPLTPPTQYTGDLDLKLALSTTSPLNLGNQQFSDIGEFDSAFTDQQLEPSVPEEMLDGQKTGMPDENKDQGKFEKVVEENVAENQSVGPTPTKRARKLGKVYMSPFLVQYSHLIEGTDEFKEAILEYAFSDVLDEDELFYDDGFAHLSRKLIKTMGDNVYIYNDIVDAFCLILNAKNSADDKRRIFFPNATINLLCVSDAYVDDSQEATYGIKYVKFEETIRYWLIDCNIESVKGYQLLFFPVYAHDHFYVMVLNTKSKAVEILDNRPLVEGVPFSEKYHDYPEKLRHAFSMYLKQHGMKLWEKVLNYEIKLVDMSWRTLDNNVDCGIYAMRHMETYFGKRKWNCGLRADNFDALKALRMQYAYEILVD